ncbi:hypothetical protein TRVA0_001S09670 [Trichomonascus vanleenenianus]|uniref:uncharacterized protein n=1 Tax=Trichomonascus vanleenenianus TaxID=2268995 RepID=UPI003ECA9D6C
MSPSTATVSKEKTTTIDALKAAVREKIQTSPETKALLKEVEKGLYGESAVAKIWGVASAQLDKPHPPTEAVQISVNGRYITNEVEDWTAGFFPGSIYALIERYANHPDRFPSNKVDPLKLDFAGRWWASYLEPQVHRTDTHDLAFLIDPALRREYEVHGTKKAREQVITAAYSLASRYDEKVGVIRSWDAMKTTRHELTREKGDYLTIIDNMMNLDMLYWAAKETGDLTLSTIATNHAKKALKDFFRHPEYSTYHLVVYDDQTGEVRHKYTVQGYDDETTWSRGQAWSINGFAQCYLWTGDKEFLEASKKAAAVFMKRLSPDYVPAWDFDAPDADKVKDVSAGTIAAEGLIKLFKATKEEKYLTDALRIVNGCLKGHAAAESKINDDGTVVFGEEDDVILRDSTRFWNDNIPFELRSYRTSMHGLCYADYYFLELGNMLLDMGLY